MSLAATLVVALASVASAYPAKDEKAFQFSRLHDLPDYKQAARNLDSIGGGNLLRDLDMLRNRAAYFSRTSRADDGRRYQYFDSLMGTTLGGHKRAAGCCLDSLGGSTLGSQKRNMDEIDRSGFNSFVKKNFDEIDNSGFGSFTKRNFDEIDNSGFGSFTKRNFDEIDNSGFGSFTKRNFDEIDNSGFGTFVRRNLDGFERSGLGSANRNAAPAAPAPDQPHK